MQSCGDDRERDDTTEPSRQFGDEMVDAVLKRKQENTDSEDPDSGKQDTEEDSS